MFKNALVLLLAFSASAQHLRGDRELWTQPVVPTFGAVQANGQANADTFGGPALATSQALANNLGAGTALGDAAAYANNFGPIGTATASAVGQANVVGGIAQGTGVASATNLGYGGIAQAAGTGIANNLAGGLASSLGSASAVNYNGGNAVATGAAQSVNLGAGGATATSSAVATSGGAAVIPGGYGIPKKAPRCQLYRPRGHLQYFTKVPEGTKVEVKTPRGTKLTFDVKDSNAEYVTVDIKPFQPYERLFHLRFVNFFGASEWTQCRYTPIALDIDHSGAVERIYKEVTIDITGDGDMENLSEWFAPEEGILIDTETAIVNGVVDGNHLFGDQGQTFSDGFEKLERHDDNKDGEVSGAELEGLAIWQDKNSNARLDEGELSTLESHGIVSLSTFHEEYVSEATLADGSTMVMEDLFFSR